MKRSPLSTPSGPSRRRQTPYEWNSYESANNRGYQSTNNVYHGFTANDGSQKCGDDFIPLDMSTPITQHKKNNHSWYSPRGGRNSYGPDGGGCNYRNSYSASRSGCNNSSNPNANTGRGNYHRSNYYNNPNNYYNSSRSTCNNSYSPYKQPGRQFHRQRKDDKGAYKRVNISEYVDVASFLEDPWKDLMKKLNDATDKTSTDKTLKSESSLISELENSDLTEKPENKLPRNVISDHSQCSLESKTDSSINVSFGTESLNTSEISKDNSPLDLEISGICFSQDSQNDSSGNVNDSVSKDTKDNIHTNESVTDTDEKNI